MGICILNILPASRFVYLDKQDLTFFLKQNNIIEKNRM